MRIDVRGQAALLPDGHLPPLAIITHELISNARRHAFPDDRRGSIAVAFSRAVGGVILVVRDSGIGAKALTPGEGLSLVQGLVEHLCGSMNIETAPGAGVGVRIRLPLETTGAHWPPAGLSTASEASLGPIPHPARGRLARACVISDTGFALSNVRSLDQDQCSAAASASS